MDYLVLLNMQTPLTARELARDIGMEASTMAGCNNRNLARGYIRVKGIGECSVTKRNVRVLELTDKGRQVIQEDV